MEKRLNPFYYPTTIVSVDDDPAFLESFTLLLDNNIPILHFTSAKQALNYINNQSSIIEKISDFTDYTFLDNAEQSIYLNVDTLHSQVFNPNRFSQVSVVITDYAMPEMGGIEFLEQIKHPEIKRVLLTGIADEKTAVKAFNDGLIDRFFLKNAHNLEEEINEALEELQHHYFCLLENSLLQALSDFTGSFLRDSQFNKYFNKLHKKYNWTEYYLIDQPQGIVFISQTGETSLLLVYSNEETRTHYEIASTGEAPEELVKILSEGKEIALFPTDDGYYDKSVADINWKECLYPADFIYGNNRNYYCSVISPAPLKKMEQVKSYQNFLTSFDSEIKIKPVNLNEETQPDES